MIGCSASGHVYVAKILSNGKKVAIKEMDLSNQPRKELIVNEILVMKESQHPNIVNFLDSYLVKNNELWVVMEFMEGGALTDIIENNTLEEEQIASISNEVRPYESADAEGRLMRIFQRLVRDWGICMSNTSSIVISSLITSSLMPRVESKSVRSLICALTYCFDILFPSRSRFRFLREAHGPKVEARDHGWHTLLDGTRGRQAEGVWRQG